MKKTIALLMILMSASTQAGAAPAGAVKALSAEQALTLFLRSVSQLKVENENPYERYDRSVAEHLSEALLSSYEQPSSVGVKCKIEKGTETCWVDVLHLPTSESEKLGYGDEWSMQFEFNVGRSKGKPVIKDNKVRIRMAG